MNVQFHPSFLPRFLAGFLLSALAGVGIAQTAAKANPSTKPVAPAPQITQAINESNLVPLKGTISSLIATAQDQGAAPDSLQTGRAILMLKTTDAQQAALDKLVNEQQNPKSPYYHQWLTPQQFGARFGAAPQDIQKITAWLEGHGFTVEAPMAGRNLIAFSGTHAQMKAAFHTEIRGYKLNGQTYWANATDPQIPAALAPAVRGFSSLNNFPRHAMHTTPQLVRREKAAWQQTNAPNGSLASNPASNSGQPQPQPQFTTDQGGTTPTLHIVAPSDLAKIYNIQPLWDAGIDGTNQTIAIVSDSDIDPADVDDFRSIFGLPAKKLNIIYYGPNPNKTGDEVEAVLDVQWAGAVAKNATIDLVVAANTAVSAGVDSAAIYIINNNLAPLLNVSYGACEEVIGTSGNQFYSLIWQQAAAQGITVLVASGDSGSDVCDQGTRFSTHGFSVSGLASTPYNVAVGGTDFALAYNTPSTYWSSTNDPTTLESALSYIPEAPWNNTCASPDVFNQLHNVRGVPDATPEALCNDNSEQTNFLDMVGGSGGPSNCTTVDDSNTAHPCSDGYPKPSWQSGVTGIPSDGVRDLPDVSLMAGSGLWLSAYVYCQADVIGQPCDVNNTIEAAGGTSFASPIFAGLLALAQQKVGSPLGNANYVLYKLASTQYADPSNASACTAANATAGNACVFYDVTTGSNTVPCRTGTTDCTTAVSTDLFGILPGHDAGAGYDMATGLGSVNAENLVNGWTGAASTFLATTTSIAISGPASVSYGTPINVSVTVSPVAPATGTPSGDIGITSDSSAPNAISIGDGTLSGGVATVSATLLPVGTYQLFARYAGDATFSSSQSAGGTSITVAPVAISASLTTSNTTAQTGQYVTLSLTLPGVTGALAPTGTATFTDTTTGEVLGSRLLIQGSGTSPVATASVTISYAQLHGGVNVISASYSGDANYAASTSSSTVSITRAAPFAASVNPGTLTLAPNGTGSVTVTATPVNGATLNPASLSFACPSGLPAGLACSFSAPTAGAGGTVSSVLTLQLAAPLVVKGTQPHAKVDKHSLPGGLLAGAAASLCCLLMIGIPRRRRMFLSVVAILAGTLSLTTLLTGCGSSSSKTTTTPALVPTTTSVSVNPSTPMLGTPVVLTATVTPGAGSATGTPTGSISFSSGSTSLGKANLSSGTASLTANSLPLGAQSITATYSGDATYATSTSSSGNVDVSFTTAITVTVTDNAGDSNSTGVNVTVQ